MREEIQSYDADYIYHNNDTSAYDLGPASLQCGRRVDSLKLWLSWKFFGDTGYAKRIEKVYALAEYATKFVEEHPKLELLFPTQSLNVNFRYRASESEDLNALNEQIRYTLLKEGQAMVNYCHIGEALSIRLVLLNPDLDQKDLDLFFGRFLEVGKRLETASAKEIVHRNA